MTKDHLPIIIMAVSLGVASWSCTKLAEDVSAHPEGWLDPNSDNFHSLKISVAGLESCKPCHGENLDGGSSGQACSRQGCHTSDSASPHPEGWALLPRTVNFHGIRVSQDGLETCYFCHGQDLEGGIAELACSNTICHTGPYAIPHPLLAEFTDPTHANYHGSVFWTSNYDFSYCQACHGLQLDGGIAAYGCSNVTCHTATDGVFACDNCHSSPTSSLPFVNVRNQSDSTVASVGLHNSHLSPVRAIRPALECNDCHLVPTSMWASGHIDDTPDQAEVLFGSLANGNGSLDPTWDHTSGTCADTYCHGNFAFAKDTSSYQYAYEDTIIVGNNDPINWTEPYTGDNFCSFCHSYPPTGHVQTYTACGICHTNVVGSDHMSIIDLSKHLNGQKNFP